MRGTTISPNQTVTFNINNTYVPITSNDEGVFEITEGDKELTTFSAANEAQLKTIDEFNYDTSKMGNMSYMFAGCINIETLNLRNIETSNVTNMRAMFMGDYKLLNLDIGGFNTSNVTDMSYMFDSCEALNALDISHFKTAKVITMSAMFNNCKKLKTLIINTFDTSNVEDMSSMFCNCHISNGIDLSNFNVQNVKDMSYMFNGFYGFTGSSSFLELTLTNFSTPNLTNANGMFGKCSEVVVIDLLNIDLSKVETMSRMFEGCSKLQILRIKDETTVDKIKTQLKTDLNKTFRWNSSNYALTL